MANDYAAIVCIGMNDCDCYYSFMNKGLSDWQLIRVFLAVSETGSLSAAALSLGSSQPTIGRQISRLEDDLQLRLFTRHQNGYRLTAEGKELARVAQSMLTCASEFERIAENTQPAQSLRPLRINCGELGLYFLSQQLPLMIAENSPLQIELLASFENYRLSRKEADMMVHSHPPQEENMIVVKLGTAPMHVYASPAFLEKHPEAHSSKNWCKLDWAGFGDTRPEQQGGHVTSKTLAGVNERYVANRGFGVLHYANSGRAIAVLPSWIAEFEPLQRISSLPVATREIWLSYTPELQGISEYRILKNKVAELFRKRIAQTNQSLDRR
ncbi:LysR family transcriptional regulator [Polycladidibacter stylochi]|uniref:LysR family transcriptional regulator n=1 Tax=Polycladidibacter stylochi TaxID=1807766 RepID=UPI00082B1BCF|nr:LysR family transcriptional regulator [Pseudovibrio stylochi]